MQQYIRSFPDMKIFPEKKTVHFISVGDVAVWALMMATVPNVAAA